jgi:hypothetical protein
MTPATPQDQTGQQANPSSTVTPFPGTTTGANKPSTKSELTPRQRRELEHYAKLLITRERVKQLAKSHDELILRISKLEGVIEFLQGTTTFTKLEGKS